MTESTSKPLQQWDELNLPVLTELADAEAEPLVPDLPLEDALHSEDAETAPHAALETAQVEELQLDIPPDLEIDLAAELESEADGQQLAPPDFSFEDLPSLDLDAIEPPRPAAEPVPNPVMDVEPEPAMEAAMEPEEFVFDMMSDQPASPPSADSLPGALETAALAAAEAEPPEPLSQALTSEEWGAASGLAEPSGSVDAEDYLADVLPPPLLEAPVDGPEMPIWDALHKEEGWEVAPPPAASGPLPQAEDFPPQAQENEDGGWEEPHDQDLPIAEWGSDVSTASASPAAPLAAAEPEELSLDALLTEPAVMAEAEPEPVDQAPVDLEPADLALDQLEPVAQEMPASPFVFELTDEIVMAEPEASSTEIPALAGYELPPEGEPGVAAEEIPPPAVDVIPSDLMNEAGLADFDLTELMPEEWAVEAQVQAEGAVDLGTPVSDVFEVLPEAEPEPPALTMPAVSEAAAEEMPVEPAAAQAEEAAAVLDEEVPAEAWFEEEWLEAPPVPQAVVQEPVMPAMQQVLEPEPELLEPVSLEPSDALSEWNLDEPVIEAGELPVLEAESADAPIPPASPAYQPVQSIDLDSLPRGVLQGGIPEAEPVPEAEQAAADPLAALQARLEQIRTQLDSNYQEEPAVFRTPPQREWAASLSEELASEPAPLETPEPLEASEPLALPEPLAARMAGEPLPLAEAEPAEPPVQAEYEHEHEAFPAESFPDLGCAALPPAIRSAQAGAVVGEAQLIESLYEKILPRMKVELGLWLQDALELQSKQLLSGVMQQLKEDYEPMFGETLRESLRQVIGEVGRLEVSSTPLSLQHEPEHKGE